MNAHALAVIELDRALATVAERATSAAGAARVRALSPVDDRAAIGRAHQRVAAARALVASEAGWRPEPVPEMGDSLLRLRLEHASWTGTELLQASILLRSSRLTKAALTDTRQPELARAVLSDDSAQLVVATGPEGAIAAAIDSDGSVRDEASPTLRRLRRELRAADGELVRLLERVVSRLESHQQVPDMSVTVRNGRYVIPVRREARGAVGGIVHDSSSTGATLFIEPPAAIEAANRIRELEADALREEDRILRELTDTVRPLRDGMAASLETLIVLDALYACARYAEEFRCAAAELAPDGAAFSIREGRHPLLLAQGVDVVPFDLALEEGERTLLVSGPNTGGKTVLLKAVALITAMVQAGVPAPLAAGSSIAVVDDFFADIGDEQSIAASLSTFSAHLRNLGEILRSATARSLVLIDELGSGTDPLEGAALGGAILEELTRRGSLTLATTHLGALKELATEVPGVVNASLQFDATLLAPTYRLLKGIPGRSYGLSIARRLALPEHVLDAAEARVPASERDVNRLLGELEARELALAEREREVSAIGDDVRERAHRLADREERLRTRERAAERESRQEARRYVLRARAEIERTISELRAAGAEHLDEAARRARRAAEDLAGAEALALDRLDAGESFTDVSSEGAGETEEALAAGDLVEVASLGNRLGRLLELRAAGALVAVGDVKMTVPVGTLRRSREQEAMERRGPSTVALEEIHAPSEIDLRGLRVDELGNALLHALDSAIRADLKSVRIIHGKGTGALRERVGEMLRKDTRVRNFRLGLWNEGGAGVTVAEFA